MSKIIFFIFILCNVSFASELVQQGPGTRSMAMGGTQISFVTGAEAVFINPASLSQMKGFDFLIAQLQVGWSLDAHRLIDQYKDASTTLGPSDLNNLYNKTHYADATIRSAFATPYITVGTYSSNYIMEIFRDPSSPTYNAHFISDYGYVIGAGVALGSNLSFGVTGRHIKRWGGLSKELAMSTLIGSNDRNQLEHNFTEKGSGNALDLALNLQFGGDAKSTYSFVWRDVGYTSFNGDTPPPAQADNLILGASWQRHLGLVALTYALEYKNITTQGENLVKKLHAGAEASLGLFDLRAGFNQGYLTYGLGIDLWLVKLDAAAYAEEIGNQYWDQCNERYMFTLSLQLDFDDAFNLTNKQGKKRRLKQRR